MTALEEHRNAVTLTTARLGRAASPEVVWRLEGLLVVPEGKRRPELDRLRRPPFSPTITGLVQALERLGEVRGAGR